MSGAEAASEVFKKCDVADQSSLCAILSKTLHVGVDFDGDAKILRHLDDFAKSPSPNGLIQEGDCSLAAFLALGKEVWVEDKAVTIN